VPRTYLEKNWGNKVSSIRESVKKRDAETEESPLLEAVTRGRLVKTQQAGKGLARAVVICELCRLAVAL
jgi:hypothetical protein